MAHINVSSSNSDHLVTVDGDPIVLDEAVASVDVLTWGLEHEYNGPGGGWTDVSPDVVDGAIECEYGIEGSDPTDRVFSTGSLSATVDNSESEYSPFHASKRTGFDYNIGQRFWLQFGTTKIYKHVGKLADILPVPGINRDRVTRLKSLDWGDDAARTDVPDLAAQTGKRGDELLTMLLDAMDDQPVARSLDTWLDTFGYAFEGGSGQGLKVLQELNKLALSEQGRIYIKGDASTGGVLRAEKRGAQALSGGPAALAFTDDIVSACMAELIMAGSRDDVYSTVRVTVHPTRVDAAATTVLFSLQQTSTFVEAGATIDTIFGPYRDPATNDACGGVDMVTPASGTDFAMNTAEDGSGTDVTADFTVTASYTGQGVRYTAITNTGGVGAFIITLQARGRGVYRLDADVERTVANSYGTQTLKIDMAYQSSLAAATFVVTYLAELLGTPAARVRGVRFCASVDDTVLEAAIALEPGDRLDITESETGLSAARFIVQKLRYELQPGNVLFVTANLVPWGLDAFWTGPGGASAIDAIGGVITDVGGYRYHTFDVGGDEEFEIVANNDAVPVEVAVIPAGGAGGGIRGGGGAGGKVKVFAAAAPVGVYPIVVGEGASASNGGDSSAFGVTGKGGGKGGTSSAGVAGGNGGGGSGPGNPGGASNDSGHTGGAGAVEDGGGSDDAGGGGAGDQGDGAAADYFLGNGGPGRLVWGAYYGAGGGGNQDTGSGNGGSGVGGNGGAGGNPSTEGTDGTGSGGGGGEDKKGGNGRVIVRYPLAV